MTERIVIIGAGMGGLLSALALQGPNREILVLDRDPPPPEGGPEAAFHHWERRGVGHLRHSHAFLARFLNLIRDRRPALLKELLDAGARETTFIDLLPERLRDGYRKAPGDEDLSILMTRRTTLEWVIRRHVSGLEGVMLRSNAFVSGLMFGPSDPERAPTVIGVRGDAAGVPTEWTADLVIDASGRTSEAPEWLAKVGAALPETAEDAGILYYTRHYRLKPGQGEPPRTAGSSTGDLGYLKYGVFSADDGWFSITLAAPEIEIELRRALLDPAVFDQICSELPGPAAWIDPTRSEPQTKVFGMGDLRSRWRRLMSEGGQPLALGLFMVGDGLIRSNPLYGRGCTFAAIEAFALADVLNETSDPGVRTWLYDQRLETDLRPFYTNMLTQDRAAIRRAARARDPAHRPGLRSRLMKSAVDDAITPYLRSDVAAVRAAISAFHMLTPPDAWVRQPRHQFNILKTWATPRPLKADAYPKPLGPTRSTMMMVLGLTD